MDDYYAWLCGLVYNAPTSGYNSYSKLLKRLFETTFVYSMLSDMDREIDGRQLRSIFAAEILGGKEPSELNAELGPCRVLEMMVAVARRCEIDVMSNHYLGDRTGQWFWEMIASLGLGQMTDARYDEKAVDYILSRFLNRQYSTNGEGGLFTVTQPEFDMREASICKQLNLYLTEVLVDEGILERRIING